MSFVFEKPRVNPGDTFAGGEASLGDIYAAALDQAKYVDNLTASAGAMEAAIDQRNKEVFRDTGVRLDNPYRAKFSAALEDAAMQEQRRFSAMQGGEAAPDQDPAAVIRKGVADWQAQVATAAARIPDTNIADRLNRSIEGDAIQIARQSDEKLGQLMASRPGLGGLGAAVAGGFTGTLRDPLQLSLMAVGGGPGAGRTIASRILSTAAKEAFINGASEAALQPVVQAWRKQAGLDNGLDVALRNVGMAAAFGGFLGGGLHGAGELVGKLAGRGLDAAGDLAAADPRVVEPLRRAIDGDARAAREQLAPIRDALPAEARGALDQVETLDHLEATRPAAISPERHDLAIAAAHRAVDAGEGLSLANPDQVARISNDIVGEAPSFAKASEGRPRSLSGFLIDHGGIEDFQGELASIGADKVSEKFRGKLVKKGGMSLDQAREAAEEAGYIGRPGEVQTTSVADLLSALDEDLRGNHVLSREDQAQAGRAGDFEAQRAGVERTVAEISAAAGPGVDDAIVHQAARLSIDEGMHPLDALEHVLTHAEESGVPAQAVKAKSGEILPGWSDAELDRASADRGFEPEPGAMPDPGKVDPELEISPAEIEQFGEMQLPGEDGRLMSLAAYVDDIKHGDELAAIVKACKA